MRILGIDCGSQHTGYGVIDSDGCRHVLVDAGTLDSRPSTPFASRLLEIGSGLREVIARHRPAEAAVEDTFVSSNARSALKLTEVRGVALFILAEAGLPVAEYPPATVKIAVAGSGRADKEQVGFMVKSLLGLPEPIASADASDAVAVAICHATRRPLEVSR